MAGFKVLKNLKFLHFHLDGSRAEADVSLETLENWSQSILELPSLQKLHFLVDIEFLDLPKDLEDGKRKIFTDFLKRLKNVHELALDVGNGYLNAKEVENLVSIAMIKSGLREFKLFGRIKDVPKDFHDTILKLIHNVKAQSCIKSFYISDFGVNWKHKEVISKALKDLFNIVLPFMSGVHKEFLR